AESSTTTHRGSSSSSRSNPHEEEERRLAYVAMSRAESQLFLTYTAKVPQWGVFQITNTHLSLIRFCFLFQSDNRIQGSRFLRDIPGEHCEKYMFDGE